MGCWRRAQSYGLPPAPQSRRVFYVGSTPGREIIRECCSGARSQAPTFTFRRRSVAAGLWTIGAQLQHENDVGAGSMPSAIEGRGLRSHAHTADKGLEPAASPRLAFLLLLSGPAICWLSLSGRWFRGATGSVGW